MSLRPARPTAARAVAVALAVAAVSVVTVLADPAAASWPDDPGVAYAPPVDAPVVDPFRAPATPYGPGNRGLTYDLEAGTAVRAAADGLVVFAGTVGGTRHVTVLHADGLRTSYSFLHEVAVRRGQQVARGDVVGTAGLGFHLGVRDGVAYLDPAGLFGEQVLRVRLVPHTEPLPPTDAGIRREHAALRELVRAEQPGLLQRVGRAIVDRAAPVVGRVVDIGLATYHAWSELSPSAIVGGIVQSVRRHLRQACTTGSTVVAAPAPGERVALLVGGLGSSSEEAAIDDVDVDALGYDPGLVLRYRYGGGRIDGDRPLHPDLDEIAAGGYAAEDTLDDIAERGRELADLVQEAATARPGRPVDIYAHSMGGLVTRFALLELADRPGGLDALGEVITMGSPHSGADLATLAVLSEGNHRHDVDPIREHLGIDVDPYATSVRQMAESSPLIDRLRGAGIPEGVSFRTIGARGDLVVTADKTDVDGHLSAIVDAMGPGAHADLPGLDDTTRELQLALAGLPPACQGVLDAVADAAFPEIVAGVTDGVGLGLVAFG